MAAIRGTLPACHSLGRRGHRYQSRSTGLSPTMVSTLLFMSNLLPRFAILAGDHHENQFIAVSFSGLAQAHYLTGFHDGYAVGGFQHVAHDVGNVDNATPALAQTSGEIKNQSGLCDTECGRRFIHDDETRIEAHALGDCDRLALASR